ncbi:D-alanyl-D-alanine carboxypeptidase [Streptomyces sp. SPB78]|nr:D-alanyl-D-alanine carboxypeptidase [Streptomyces sp. SPB78]
MPDLYERECAHMSFLSRARVAAVPRTLVEVRQHDRFACVRARLTEEASVAGESPDRAQEHNSPEGSARTRTTGTGGGIPVSRPDDRLRAAVAQWVRSADETEEPEARAAEPGAGAGEPAAGAEEPAVRADEPAAKPAAGPSWAREAREAPEDDGTEPGGTGAGAAPEREAEAVPVQADEPRVPEESPEPEAAKEPAEEPGKPGHAGEPDAPDEAEAAADEPAGQPEAPHEPEAEPKSAPESALGSAPEPKADPEPKPAPATRGLSFHKVDTPTTSLSVFGVVRPAADHTTTVLKLPEAEAPSSKLSDAPKAAAPKPAEALKAPKAAEPKPADAPEPPKPAGLKPAGPLPDEEPPAERTSKFVPLRPLDDARPAALRPKDPRAAARTTAEPRTTGKDAEKAPGKATDAAPAKAKKKPRTDAPAARPSEAAAGKSAQPSGAAAGKSAASADDSAAKSSSPFGAGYTASQPDNATTGSTPSSTSPTTPASITAEIPVGTAVGAEETRQQPLPPKAPLDLLAELTNTPPPPETPMRTVVRRFKIWTPLVLLLVVVLGIVQAVRPLPQPTLSLTAATTYQFSGKAAAMPWPKSGQAAMDVDGLGSFGSSGTQKPVPIASVAKVMTAYLVLRDHPVKKGGDGASITMDQKAEDDAGLSAQNESTVDVRAGQKLSQKEAIEAIMLASANNIARQLARWDAGSEKDFVAKMNKAADELGMKNTTYTDPSGLNKTTVSTAEDQVKLGKVAMKDPLFREVVRMPAYVDSNGKTQTNWNRLVPMNNTVGIKTGTTTAAGGNLLYAATKEVGGTTRTIVGAVLAQPPAPEDNSILTGALNAGKALIEAAQGTLVAEKVVKKGDVVGSVDDGLGGTTPVVAAKDLTAVGWPGLTVRLKLVDDGTPPPHEAAAGTKVGVLRAGDGTSSAVEVPVVLRSALSEPGLGTKLTRLG